VKFILTRELGRLCKWLRILGFDTEYYNQDNMSSLIIQALREERIILTRNKKLISHQGIKVIEIKEDLIKNQLVEVLKALKIHPASETMFTRCIICNQNLINIDKQILKDKVPEYVFNTQKNFVFCPNCKRIYWQGTHWGNVERILREINH